MAAVSSISNVENLSPQIIRRVAKEMSELAAQPPEGIRVILNEEDVTDIQAIIEGPSGTPYAGGFFRVKLALGKDFPQGPPKAFFLTKIFHPNVAKNGEICVNTLKKDWKSDLGIKHILLTVKCLLIVPNAESALNEEAGKLLLEREVEKVAKQVWKVAHPLKLEDLCLKNMQEIKNYQQKRKKY
ncbi:ubiquitin-conjugating enzyme E2 S isoform X3 [Apis cerana]|uniref:E2 ubiquitin-conjugating enzyme n=1 Tax=Apis mellifera TaxID=7460 RepID=A0A7M7GA88_APIME|nr:ubiquitin-conjugating enzyme E2 S isoform X4 [Apis mellifera]XP_016910635.1 ubiquitin-conjugating enzyme E2 S isoform X3 [Apis cerana]|eukprot:XP_003249805.1 ubiquitin-conjugating enzyme E2 S isoform X4 [Apis mellifera]